MIHIIRSEDFLYDVCYSIAQQRPDNPIYFDLETTNLDPHTSHILLLSFKFDEDEYVLDCTQVTDWASIIKPFFEDSSRIKVAHNFVFDYKFLLHNGIDASPGYCTLVSEQLLTSGIRSLSNTLQAVSLRRLQQTMDKSIREGFIGRAIEEVSFTEEELTYAAKDVQVLPLIRAQQLNEIKQERMERVHDLEMQLLPVTAKMEYAGIDFDTEKHREAIPAFERVRAAAAKAMQDTFINSGIVNRIVFSDSGYEAIRLSSPPQKLEAFRALGITVDSVDNDALIEWDAGWTARSKRKKTGLAGSKKTPDPDLSEALMQAQPEDDDIAFNHPLLRQHAIFMAAEKALSTYLLPLPSKINPVTKRIHPNFNQCGAAATGRYSSSSPNFQNIMKKRKLELIGLGNHDIRAMFISGQGHKFIAADFSSIELVILAALSDDKNLIAQIQKGDVHSLVGSTLFNTQFDKKMAEEGEPYATYRDVAKTTTYAIMYGSTGYNLYRKLSMPLATVGFEMTRDMGDQWIDQWYGLFPDTGKLLRENAEKAVTKLYTESILGRRRHWSYDMLRTRGSIEAAKREGKNAPIQSSSADITKLSELLLSKELDWNEAQLIASIHDELIVRARDEYVEKYLPIMAWAMEEAGKRLFPNLPAGMISAKPKVSTYYSK